MPTREMRLSTRALEVNWINVHSSPAIVSADVEFFNSKFADSLRYFDIDFQPRTAPLHNKLGFVERENSVVRKLIQRLLVDASYFDGGQETHSEQEDILSRAVNPRLTSRKSQNEQLRARTELLPRSYWPSTIQGSFQTRWRSQ